MKKIISIFSLFLLGTPLLAQNTEPAGFWRDPLSDPLFPFYVVIAFVFVVALLVVIVAFYMLQVLNVFIRKGEEEKAAKAGKVYAPEPGAWTKFWNRINGYRPIEKEPEIMLAHNYDGIKELDNHLPPWWTWLFYGTIVWGAVYLVVYHVTNSLPLMDEEYQNEVSVAQEQKAKLLAAQPALAIDENTLVYEHDEQIIKNGRQVYVVNCASCHMPDGQGSIGPNLTDEYWLHGGSVKDIFKVIKDGVQEKGMIPWGPVLSPQQIRDVTFYIKSIKGTNPPNPKAPQGELFKDEDAVPASSEGASM
ncbi:cbb3-type cytochrome c oxidase N-terminal domain-containing protein [Oscillatoria amoena NRMC-F 0135]|nr:cbb3-type cytochrome c oxidase N-terminal domain-containing protein [Oscillatoria amoena NRMC-F 0135]